MNFRSVYDGQFGWQDFQKYCYVREFFHLQSCTKGCSNGVIQMDQAGFDYLRSMDNQWQYFRRPTIPYGFANFSPLQRSINNFRPTQNNQRQSFNNTSNRCNISSSNQLTNHNYRKTILINNNGSNNSQKHSFYNTKANETDPKHYYGVKRIRRHTRSKLNDGRPKRPLTSFMLYLKDSRNSIMSTLPARSSSQEINRAAGAGWHSLPEDDKEYYKNKAAESLRQWKFENGIKDVKSTVGSVEENVVSNSESKKVQDELLKSSSESSSSCSSSSDSSSSEEEDDPKLL